MIETRFKFHIYILPILVFTIPVALYNSLQEGGFSPNLPLFMILFISSLMIFSFVFLLFGELRTKAIYMKIENDKIIVKPYLGLGLKKEFKIDHFDGYTISDLYSFGGIHEYLYLIKNDKKIIKISEFHHSNYMETKKIIHTKFDFVGRTKFKILDELIEIFK